VVTVVVGDDDDIDNDVMTADSDRSVDPVVVCGGVIEEG
jgi:hypothetical protein